MTTEKEMPRTVSIGRDDFWHCLKHNLCSIETMFRSPSSTDGLRLVKIVAIVLRVT